MLRWKRDHRNRNFKPQCLVPGNRLDLSEFHESMVYGMWSCTVNAIHSDSQKKKK